MAITTLSVAPTSSVASRIKAIFSSVMAHMIASREREARRYVARYLSSYDDAALRRLGYDPRAVRSCDKAAFIL